MIHKLRLPANERLLSLAATVALPLCPLAFFLVRLPLDHWLVAQLGATSAAYKWLATFYAPLTEEPAKLIPLLIPAIRRDLNARNFVRYALAIGVGFAIGEMWLLADRVARMPAFAALPFYQFGGYVSERLMVCMFHSAFVAVALWRWRRRFAFGVASAAAETAEKHQLGPAVGPHVVPRPPAHNWLARCLLGHALELNRLRLPRFEQRTKGAPFASPFRRPKAPAQRGFKGFSPCL